MAEERRVQRIIDFVSSINEGQICIEPSVDTDLDFKMFGYRDADGIQHKVLNKDEAARVQHLDLIQNGHASEPGRLCYDGTTNGLIFGLSDDVSLNVGEEFLFYAENDSGSEITNGLVTSLTGASGSFPTIGVADKDTASAYSVLGVATEDIADGALGYSTGDGTVRGLDLSSFSTGDHLWLGDDGALQTAQPNAPAYSTYIGFVLSDDGVNGSMLTRVQPIPRLWQLSDVDRSTALTDGVTPKWVSANSRFEFDTFLTAADAVTSLRVDGSSTYLRGDLKFYSGTNCTVTQTADGFSFEASTGGTSTAALAQNAVGFGGSSNELTGDATNFRYLSATRQMLIGSGTPGSITTATDSLYVEGQVEFDEDVFIDGPSFFSDEAQFSADTRLSFGGTNSSIEFDTNQTVSSMAWWLSSAATLLIAPKDDATNDYGYSAETNPTLILVSNNANTDATERLSLSDIGTDALLHVYKGSFLFQDAYLTTSTNWSSSRQRLYTNQTEVDAIYSLLGDAEGSVAAAILAAAAGSGGVTLDGAYDFGGAGAGKSVSVDAGAISFVVPAGTNNLCLNLTALETTATSDILQIYNNSIGRSIYFNGGVGATDPSTDGHIIESNGSTSYKATFTGLGSSYIKQQALTNGGDAYPVIIMYAEEDGQTDYGKILVDSKDGGLVRVEATEQVIISSGVSGSGIALQGFAGGINCTGIVSGAAQYLGFAASTVAGFTSGVIDLDYSTGHSVRNVSMSQNVTEVEVIDPNGTGDFYLWLVASGGSRSVTNFTSATSTPFTWIGNYDLNANPITVPSGEALCIKMTFLGTALGWSMQVVSEV